MSTAGRVTAIVQAGGFRQPAERQPREAPRQEVSAGRALVVAAPSRAPESEDRRLPSGRAFTPFLAQLAGMRAQAPQFRRRRRAEPAVAAACYAASGQAAPARPRLNRSV